MRLGKLAGMNQQTECRGSAGAEELNYAAVADRRYMGAAREDTRPTFDSIKASQARSELIKATIIFFGLDHECPCPSGNLHA